MTGNGFFPEPLPSLKVFKSEGNPQKTPCPPLPTPPKCLGTWWHSPECRGLMWGCATTHKIHDLLMKKPYQNKSTNQNQTEPLERAAYTNSLAPGPHPKPWSCQAMARWGTAPQTRWALTLVTLLLTVLMLQMLLTLLGMVVIRMGVLRRPRVTSAREARGVWGLTQPTDSAPQLRSGSGCATHLPHTSCPGSEP